MDSTSQPDEIDGAALRAIERRFRAHHAHRIERTGERLISRHRRVLEALPMLYHRNHPALPGYVGAGTPHGICNYRPGTDHVRALGRVARSYDEPLLPPQRSDIHAMFLMGSGGTVGQSRGSDLDLWVCCDSLVHAALWPKVRVIDRWAAELGLELHTFLVDAATLRVHRRLPGSRIPMLVLDEFYRTGALLAGRYPLWWLIDEDDPGRYAASRDRLMNQRFVPADAVVDFGPVGPIPPEELAHGALTELRRALTTPQKSLLKLKLMETYALAPEQGPVSSVYRGRIHAARDELLDLDPYLLLYDHVAHYLQQAGREAELTLVRRLLIGKAAESVPWHSAARSQSTEARALLARFESWGFDPDAVARFRSIDRWTMAERLAEHMRILTALERGLELSGTLVARTRPSSREGPTLSGKAAGRADADQLSWLNHKRLRQLHAAIGRLRSPDGQAIPVLHPALFSRGHPPTLRLHRENGCWRIRESGVPLKRCARLVEAVIWSERNGANLVPAPRDTLIGPVLLQILQGYRDAGREHIVFLNAESAPGPMAPWPRTAAGADATRLTLPGGSDQGSTAGLDLATLDVVSRHADGHWRVEAATDPGTVLEALGRLLARAPESVSWQDPGGQQRFVAVERLRRLHELAWRILEHPGGLFVLPLGGAHTITIRRDDVGVESRRHRSLAELQAYLESAADARVGIHPGHPRLKGLQRAG